MRIVCNPELMVADSECMKVTAVGVHAVNLLMLLQRLSPAIIRFLIQEVVVPQTTKILMFLLLILKQSEFLIYNTYVSMSSGPEKKGHAYGTRRKSLGTRKKPSTALDLDADDRSFIRVLSDDDSDDDDDPVIFWSAFATWEVVPTPLGDINALYMMDSSSKYFTHLREILHLVDRQDLLKLYGMVVKYYEDHPLAGAGMMIVVDFKYYLNHMKVDMVLWFDGSYPLSVQLMKKMLKHKLEIEIDGVGNDMTYAEQLIQFIKNQIAASIPSA
ncbi:hypothetical protein Tco_0971762 [Tanacetum coccineum]